MASEILKQELELVRKTVLESLRGYRARVYLFGSQATGRARLHSDIDIAILPLQPIPSLTLFKIREILEESEVVRYVDVVDLSETDEAFRKRVEKEGILWKE
jgi:uncharacterized protein